VGPDGRSVITAMSPGVHRPDAEGHTDCDQKPETSAAAIANTPVQWVEQSERTRSSMAPTRRPGLVLHTAASFAFAVLAASHEELDNLNRARDNVYRAMY